MKGKILFIVNPISGFAKHNNIDEIISKHINKNKYEYKVLHTKYAKHATLIAKENLNLFDIICAIGGDGIINEISKALLFSNTKLAIIPAGSGNGLARHLKIPLHFKESINVINDGFNCVIDTATLNNEHFINVAGVGFDAHVAEIFDKNTKRGPIAYAKIVLKELMKFKELDIQIETSTGTIHKKAFLMSFANSSQFGNNAFIAPKASLHDGLIDCVIIKKPTFFNYTEIMHKLFTKQIDKHSGTYYLQSKKITIECKTANWAHLDGETIKINKNIQVEAIPQSLKIIVPKEYLK